jgi:DNA-binding NarL/FixJ family response regulator
VSEPQQPPIRVIVADDQRAVREALATVLEVLPGIEVIGLACDGGEAIELARSLNPDVILMDLRMPNTDGIAATREINAELPGIRVVVLTTFADDSSIRAALEAGAIGYLTKDAGREQIALAVQSAAIGQSVLDPAAQATLLRAAWPPGSPAAPAPNLSPNQHVSAGTPPTTPLPDDLTAREAEVLQRIAAGRTNAEIAEELFIAEVTVKSHINHLFAKIRARSRAEAVRYAYDHGLAEPL